MQMKRRFWPPLRCRKASYITTNVSRTKEAEADDNFQDKIDAFKANRAALDAAMQSQIKKSQEIYELVDQPINTLGRPTSLNTYIAPKW